MNQIIVEMHDTQKKDKMCKFDPKMHQTLGGGLIVKFEKSLL